MGKIVPDAYISSRSTNGNTLVRSGTSAVHRATRNAMPVLKTKSSNVAGTIKSQRHVMSIGSLLGRYPDAYVNASITAIAGTREASCDSTAESGSTARGKCSDRTRLRLPEIDL